ncbi:13831_t:CDS:1, partial [Cetraspora pellucida]
TSKSSISCLTNNTVITSSVNTNQIKEMNERGDSRRRSWVWDHFKLLPTIYRTKSQYNELKNNETKCNHIIKTDRGIGNFSYYPQSVHGIIKLG